MSVKGRKVGFVGGGNMGEALVRGLVESNLVPPEAIGVADVRAERRGWGFFPFSGGCCVLGRLCREEPHPLLSLHDDLDIVAAAIELLDDRERGDRKEVVEARLFDTGVLLAGDDERDALHGRGHVTEPIHLAVRRHELFRLADHRDSEAAHLGNQLLLAQADPKPGDALQLVQRSTSVSEPAAAHHRDFHTSRCRERREDQADLVADSAGRVLVRRLAAVVFGAEPPA